MNVTVRRCTRLSTLIALALTALSSSAQTRLVISQMYGGGGNTGAQFTNDFLELYNPTSSAISLNGLSIQYAAATSAAWNSVALPAAVVQPGHYFLIQAAAGTTVPNSPLSPPADFVVPAAGSSGNPLNFSATAGKVAIVHGAAALTLACPAPSAYVTLIGYGPTANCYEGTGPAPAPSNTTADVRANPNADNFDNPSDFTIAAPTPHNSGSAAAPVTPPTLAIHAIQGVKSTTASTLSPYAGQQVTTTGVVTAVLSNAFFIQSRDVDADTNPLTPEGIEVFTGSPTSAAAVLGNYVQVTGTVHTFPAVYRKPHARHRNHLAHHHPRQHRQRPAHAHHAHLRACSRPRAASTSSPPTKACASPSPPSPPPPAPTAPSPPPTKPPRLATSTGYFYAVITGTPRPFREPGIDIRDPAVPGTPASVAHFDDNPERILVDSVIAGGTSIEISTGAVLPNVTGVLDFTFSTDSFYDPSRLILDAAYNRANVSPA